MWNSKRILRFVFEVWIQSLKLKLNLYRLWRVLRRSGLKKPNWRSSSWCRRLLPMEQSSQSLWNIFYTGYNIINEWCCKSLSCTNLFREEHWNKWKNEGCPSFAKKLEENVLDKPIGDGGSYRRKKRKLGDLVRKI